MSEIITFLQTYWKLITLCILVIFDVVLVILNRRKPLKVYDSIHQFILAALPEAIRTAEQSYAASGQGDKKLSMVKELVFNYLKSCYGFDTEKCLEYDAYITRQVEDILSTPQKKEIL